jgi:hypothetical protein
MLRARQAEAYATPKIPKPSLRERSIAKHGTVDE